MEVCCRRVGSLRCRLGEGPWWSAHHQALFFLDCIAGQIHRVDGESEALTTWTTGRFLGSLVLWDGGEGGGGGDLVRALVASDRGLEIAELERGRSDARMLPLPGAEGNPLPAGQRMNDGICDRLGQFVVGSMIARREDRAAADAGLYRLGRSGRLETLLEGGIAVSNGPCFSPDGKVFYFTDGRGPRLWAWDYDPRAGLTNKRLFFDFTGSDVEGGPDGCTVCASGHVWCVPGRQLAEISAEGELLRLVPLPQIEWGSSLTFGGKDLDRVFVTSSSDTGNRQTTHERAGWLWEVTGLGVRGLAEPTFAGLGAAL